MERTGRACISTSSDVPYLWHGQRAENLAWVGADALSNTEHTGSFVLINEKQLSPPWIRQLIMRLLAALVRPRKNGMEAAPPESDAQKYFDRERCTYSESCKVVGQPSQFPVRLVSWLSNQEAVKRDGNLVSEQVAYKQNKGIQTSENLSGDFFFLLRYLCSSIGCFFRWTSSPRSENHSRSYPALHIRRVWGG